MVTLEQSILARFESLNPTFNEKTRRFWGAAEAMAAGRGGITAVYRATGISRKAIQQGIRDLEDPQKLQENPNRTRMPGGGRKITVDVTPRISLAMGYCLQENLKISEGKQYPDLNLKFEKNIY